MNPFLNLTPEEHNIAILEAIVRIQANQRALVTTIGKMVADGDSEKEKLFFKMYNAQYKKEGDIVAAELFQNRDGFDINQLLP